MVIRQNVTENGQRKHMNMDKQANKQTVTTTTL